MDAAQVRLFAPSCEVQPDSDLDRLQDVLTCPQRSDFRKVSPTMNRLLLLMGLLGLITT